MHGPTSGRATLLILVCATPSILVPAAPVWEDDVVQLLHMRQVQTDSAGEDAGEQKPSMEVGMAMISAMTPGALPIANVLQTNSSAKRTEAMDQSSIQSSLLQAWRAKLSAAASYTASYRDGYGLLTIVAITLFAFVSSCCAIVSTRAFLLQDNCDAMRVDSVFGMHERRQRLMHGLRSMRPSSGPTPHFKSPTRGSSYKPWRQLVIDQPLEGDRLGVNLTEDTLVITSFTDARAEAFGFKVGDRIVHINGVPVFKQLDFLQVLSGAMRDWHEFKKPVVVTTVDPTSNSSSKLDLQRASGDLKDVCGRWQLSSGETFVISRSPGVEQLLLTLIIGDSTAATGLIFPDGPDLRCHLFRLDNSEFGEAWLSFNVNTQKMEASLKPAGSRDFGKVLGASKHEGPPSQQATPLPRPREFSDGMKNPSAASSWQQSMASLPPKQLSGETVGMGRQRRMGD
mmetsp:Transcript_42212/g.78539  ORF Transcript_42212/g.78539 Transcript_42212/m.78539 type:complete len:455 (+) Transcript_42212:58-1422(+)